MASRSADSPLIRTGHSYGRKRSEPGTFIRPTFYRKTLSRVATRYINKFKFPPNTPVELEEYLHYMPVVPKVLPQIVNGFISQIVVPYETAQCVAVISQQLQLGPSERSVILDIDVFREKFFADEEEAWKAIATLRDVKNLIFFDSITRKTVTLYK